MTLNPSTTTRLTYDDYAAIPNDGRRHEIIDGEHYVNAAPSLDHQTVSKRLQHQLYTKIELAKLGTIYNAPCDVQLSEHDIVQPDLLVVLNSSARILTPSRVQGTPDLLVEILSPSTVNLDRTIKKGVYQRFGVPEYWIVDPSTHLLEQMVLRQGNYESRVVSDEVRAEFAGGIVVNLREVW